MIAFALGFASAVVMLLAWLGWVLVQPVGKGLPRR